MKAPAPPTPPAPPPPTDIDMSLRALFRIPAAAIDLKHIERRAFSVPVGTTSVTVETWDAGSAEYRSRRARDARSNRRAKLWATTTLALACTEIWFLFTVLRFGPTWLNLAGIIIVPLIVAGDTFAWLRAEMRDDDTTTRP